jgi:hypothetical protein
MFFHIFLHQPIKTFQKLIRKHQFNTFSGKINQLRYNLNSKLKLKSNKNTI